MVRKYFQSLLRELAFMSHPIFWGSRSCLRVFYRITSFLEVFFLGDITCPSVPYDKKDSEIIGGTASLLPQKCFPCLFIPHLVMDKVSTGCLIFPKVPNFLGFYPELSEGFLHDCEERPRKYDPFLFFLRIMTEKVWMSCFSSL